MRRSLLVFCLLLFGSPCEARVEHSLAYTKAQAFNGALRYLRVNARYAIAEKDSESGYLLFEYPTEGSAKTTPGSIEVIERESTVTLIVQLPQLPHQHERILAAGLMKKLRDDYGEPPKVKKKPESKKPPAEPEEPRDNDKGKFPSPPIQRAP